MENPAGGIPTWDGKKGREPGLTLGQENSIFIYHKIKTYDKVGPWSKNIFVKLAYIGLTPYPYESNKFRLKYQNKILSDLGLPFLTS